MNRSSSLRIASGYTLFELVMVMGIVAILAAIALPSFKYVTASNRIATEVNQLLGDMRYARTEAVKDGLPVTVCASSNGTACSNADTWQLGWIIFADPNNNQTLPNGAFPLRVQGPFSTAFNSTDTLVADNAFVTLTFNREGFATTHIATPANTVTMELHSTPNNQSWTRCLAISPIGLLSIQKALVGNCT